MDTELLRRKLQAAFIFNTASQEVLGELFDTVSEKMDLSEACLLYTSDAADE